MNAQKSLPNIFALLLVALTAILSLVFFVESRDPVGFLGWIFAFGIFVSVQPQSASLPTSVPLER